MSAPRFFLLSMLENYLSRSITMLDLLTGRETRTTTSECSETPGRNLLEEQLTFGAVRVDCRKGWLRLTRCPEGPGRRSRDDPASVRVRDRLQRSREVVGPSLGVRGVRSVGGNTELPTRDDALPEWSREGSLAGWGVYPGHQPAGNQTLVLFPGRFQLSTWAPRPSTSGRPIFMLAHLFAPAKLLAT